MSLRQHYHRHLGKVIPTSLIDEVDSIRETIDSDIINKIAIDGNSWGSSLAKQHGITNDQVNIIRNLFRPRKMYDTDL